MRFHERDRKSTFMDQIDTILWESLDHVTIGEKWTTSSASYTNYNAIVRLKTMGYGIRIFMG